MARATIDGLTIGYELIGNGQEPWAITPGGRFSKDSAGLGQLAEAIAAGGKRVLIWDRPNCGESDVCFEGPSESSLHADALAKLVRHLELGPTVLVGGSAGARVSLFVAANHPEVVAAVAALWISGGVFGLMTLGNFYCGESLRAAWTAGMEAVSELPEWAELLERNPSNRDRLLALDREEFVATMDRWMAVYYPRAGEAVPGLTEEVARRITAPVLVYRSGNSDCWHPRKTSEAVADLIPGSRIIDPPWPDTEWIDGLQRMRQGPQPSPWARWPLLAPGLLAWADEVL